MIQTDSLSLTQAAYEAGKDCALNGANIINCHFRHFATRQLTGYWERGKAYGETIKAKKMGQG